MSQNYEFVRNNPAVFLSVLVGFMIYCINLQSAAGFSTGAGARRILGN